MKGGKIGFMWGSGEDGGEQHDKWQYTKNKIKTGVMDSFI